MTEKELRRLSRADLLEMLIDQSTELQSLREKLAAAEEALNQREITIEQAGSIAEASLQLNGVFDAAQAAAQQYLENIKDLNGRQEAICAQREKESLERAEKLLTETEQRCAQMESETKIQCAEMTTKAKAQIQAYWDDISKKLNDFYEQHAGLCELLSTLPIKH